MPNGRVMLKSHPLLSRHGLYRKSACHRLRRSELRDYVSVALEGRDTKTQDDVQTKDEDVRRGFLMTEAGIEVDYGGLTMAYLGNVSAT